MEYESTRGMAQRVSAAQVIVAGQAPDGGLYVPCRLPRFTVEDIRAMAALPYTGRARAVLAPFLTDFSGDELAAMLEAAYGGGRFPPGVAPVADIGDGGWLVELFRGPTAAFKDFALQLLPHLLTASMAKTGERREVAILVATSGDTGKAALAGFADVPGTRVCVFYPQGAVSDIQRLQMTTAPGDNVRVLAVEGNFDSAQREVKAMFKNRRLGEQLAGRGYVLSSANSINWGRLAPQMAYYFSAYCDLAARGAVAWGEAVNIAVPTGNFGNILAAFLAKECGLPVGRLICASNRNRVLTDFFESGLYDSNRAFFVTSSPSMDILVSSNLERLLYLLSGRDGEATANRMITHGLEGRYRVDEGTLARLREHFWAGWCDEAETAGAIAALWREHGQLCDTHTAVGWKVWRDYVAATGDRRPALIAATASPFKFPGSVLAALGQESPQGAFDQLRALSGLAGEAAPAGLAGLEGAAERFDEALAPDRMIMAVDQWLA